MLWFTIGAAVFFIVNFVITLCLMQWGLTKYSYDERFENERKTKSFTEHN